MCIKNSKKNIIYNALLKDNTQVFFNLVQPECKNCISYVILLYAVGLNQSKSLSNIMLEIQLITFHP